MSELAKPDPGEVRSKLELGTGKPWRTRTFGESGFLLVSAPLSVIYTWADEEETPGLLWLHASIAHANRMPRYEELQLLHASVFGPRWGYEIFAPAAAHVNLHEYARHLWGRLDGQAVLPNFGKHGTI